MAVVHQRGKCLRVLLPGIIVIGLVLGIVGYVHFASQSASYLPSASQSASYSIVLSEGKITPDRLNIVAARGESIKWNIQVSGGIPGYWASDTGLVLTLAGVSSPLTVIARQADNWDKVGFVKCCHQQITTITSTLTIPSTIGGPKQRSLSGTLAGTIVYPVEVANPPPFGSYEDQTLNVSIPVYLQLVS